MNTKQTNETALSIPEWTANDYLNSSTPFEWLYEHKDNKFVMAQLVDKVKKHAGGVGVKNFITLWRAYLEMRNKANGHLPAENVTEFDGQPAELYCGDYTCDDAGITYINKFGSEVIVCRHPIIPIRRLVNIDTGEVKLELAFKRGTKWSTIVTEKSTLASSQKIIELSGIGIAADSENAKELVSFITFIESENYEKMGETNCVGRLGWIGDYGFSPYVDNLRFDGDKLFSNLFQKVVAKGDRQKWMDLVGGIRKSGSVANIQIAASFASALIEPLGCLPFFVHLWGDPGKGKTVGLMVAASVWANPDMGQYVRTFNSTSVGNEIMAGFLNSLPLCLDELQIVKERKDFDKEIYMLTEGIGRSRGAKTGGLQKILTWRNCILTTGEMPIISSNSGGGAVSRVIDINYGDTYVVEKGRETVEILKRNYGFAGREFVTKVSENRKYVEEVYNHYFTNFSLGNSVDKQSASAALLMTADQLIDEWIFNDGCRIDVRKMTQFLTTKNDVDVNIRALSWLCQFVEINPMRFRATDNTGEVWGDIEDGIVSIFKTVFDSKMQDAGFNPTSFLSWAKRRGILICDHGRNVKQKRLKGSDIKTWCVCFAQNQSVVVGDNDELDF